MSSSIVKRPIGRPSDYDPKYADELIKYFDVPATFETPIIYTNKKGDTVEKIDYLPVELPTLAGFCKMIRIHRETLLNWAGLDENGEPKHPEFFDAYKYAKDCQEYILSTNSLLGKYNPLFAIFFAKNNIGWKDRTDITTNDKDLPVPILGKQIALTGNNALSANNSDTEDTQS